MIFRALTMVALSAAPAWREVAKDGTFPKGASSPEALAALEQKIAGLKDAQRAQVTATLDALAASPATPEGIKGAYVKMNEAMTGLVPPDWSGSGEHPARVALRAAGMRVLHGLVARSKKEAKGKLNETIRALPGLDSQRQQELLEEAR